MNEENTLVTPLKTLSSCECSCEKCKEMCKRPCWGTPQDIQKLIDAGYEDRLNLDFYSSDDESPKDIELLGPALKGFEGKNSPFIPRSEKGCTFWKDGLCELHIKGIKPTEGKLSGCEKTSKIKRWKKNNNLHFEVAKTWKSSKGKQMVKKWKKKKFRISIINVMN